jgi:DNA-binding transcriptional MerR regulator
VNVGEFAELAGITVRALHHYDRMGLLKPRRTASGYRRYEAGDLERLEQIVALKFLGMPLRQIGTLLGRKALDLPDALRAQRQVLEEKRALIGRAIDAIREAEQSPDAGRLRKIIEVIEMQSNTDWTAKYYSPEAREKIESRKAQWTPELQAQATQQWTDLYRDVTAASEAGEDPAGEVAQALVARWQALVNAFTSGDYEIASGLQKLWSDQANWPAEAAERMKPFVNPVVGDFLEKARRAGD